MHSVLEFMTQTVKSKSRQGARDEGLVARVGTAVLSGLGNLLDIAAHEARAERDEETFIIITKSRREKVN